MKNMRRRKRLKKKEKEKGRGERILRKSECFTETIPAVVSLPGLSCL